MPVANPKFNPDEKGDCRQHHAIRVYKNYSSTSAMKCLYATVMTHIIIEDLVKIIAELPCASVSSQNLNSLKQLLRHDPDQKVHTGSRAHAIGTAGAWALSCDTAMQRGAKRAHTCAFVQVCR